MPKWVGGVAFPPLLGGLILLLLTKEITAIFLSSKIVHTKFGRLMGSLVTPNNRGLRDVEVFLGVPYAAPPVGPLRFMPPTTQKEWSEIRTADVMPPVCPQKLPDVTNRREALKKMPLGRYNYLQRLLPQLRHQSEDCLYLNIYAPIREMNENPLPVMVYIHGESYEWNSGNPYDGSVLASYGRVIVITINFRLGVLGFLRHSLSERSVSNFGLLDQNAALHWIKENIKNFGGHPSKVTIFGHGTGAALANLLLLSPITSKEGSIHRAILMSGSALSRWAVTEDPYKYTIQVAKALKCPLIYQGDELVNCLRSKTVEELLAVPIQAPPFTTPLGPIVDDIVIKRDSYRQDGINISTLKKYDILYGVTAAESFNILTASEVRYGMSEERKNRLLRAYISNTFDHQTSVIYTAVSNAYKKSYSPPPNVYSASSFKKEIRDQALDILSDAQIVAPVVNMGDVHSAMNSRSYFYVFNHQSIYGDYPSSQGTVHGEELAYIFGAPLVGGFSHFAINYTFDEQFLSELVMTLWTNFANTGNPNLPPPQHYLTEGTTFDWEENMKRMWPAYDSMMQQYLHIDMQVLTKLHYRASKLDVWNQFIPSLITSTRMPMEPVPPMPTITPIYLVPTVPAHFHLPFNPLQFPPPPTFNPVPAVPHNPPTSPVQMGVEHATPAPVAGTPMSVVIVIGISILFLNCFAMAGIYYKRDKLRIDVRNGRRSSKIKKNDQSNSKEEAELPESQDLLPKYNDEAASSVDRGFTKSSSHLYHSNEVLLDSLYHSKSESTLIKKETRKMPLSHNTLPRDISKALKSQISPNDHKRNKSENSIYSEVGIHTNGEEIYKKNPSVKFDKSGTLPSKLMTKSSSSISSIKSTSSRSSVKSSTSRTSAKSSGSSKPLKKNASVQSLPTSEYGWGITKEMTMSRHEPEGRDDKQMTADSHQSVESFQKKNYPKVLPNVPIIISENSILRASSRPYPPPRSTSLTSRDFDELDDMHVIYRKKEIPGRDASTGSCDLSNINPFYGMGGGEAPASPMVVYGTTSPTATVRRSSGIYSQFALCDGHNQPKVPLAPQPPKSPNLYFSRVKGGYFATFGKGEQENSISPIESLSSTPIILATSSAVVTSSSQPTYGMGNSTAYVESISNVESIDKEMHPYSSESDNISHCEVKDSSDKSLNKRSLIRKQPSHESNREKHPDKPLKSVLKQTSAYDKPKAGNSPTSLSSSASINLSNVSSSSCISSNSSSASNSSIYASQFPCEAIVGSKKGAVVIAPTTRNKLK